MTTPALPTATDDFSLKFLFHSGWGYLRNELLYLMWALMEVALLTPLTLAIFSWTRYWPPSEVAVWLVLLLLLPFNLARLMHLFQFTKERQQAMMAVALLLTIVLSLRTLLHHPTSLFDFGWAAEFFQNLAEEGNQVWTRDIAIFSLVCFMWWRGIRLIGRQPDIQKAGLRLRVGGLILVPIVVWISIDLLLWQVTPFVLLFFAAGLTAVSLIRAEQIEQLQSGYAAALAPKWVGSIGLVTLSIVFTGAVIAILISGQSAALIAGWLAPVWAALRFSLTTAVITTIYLAQPLLQFLGWLVQILIEFLARIFSVLSTAYQDIITTPAPVSTSTPDPLVTATPTPIQTATESKVIIILIMIAIVLVVSLTLSRLYRQAVVAQRQEGTVDAAHQTAVSPSLGQRLLDRLGLWRHWRTAVSIRRIYQQMCQAAAGAGYPRVDTETPYEYIPTLTKVWPTNTSDTHLITQAYVKIRYGELPETPEELNQIRAAWRRLEQTKPQERGQNQ